MDLPDELVTLVSSKDVGERLRATFHGPPKHVNPHRQRRHGLEVATAIH